jgi:predicted DNA repair protein MutK
VTPSAPLSLPHTWRPLGVRVMLWVVGALLIALLVAVWIGLGDDIRAEFTVFQRVTLVLFGVLLVVVYYGLLRCKVVASPEGLRVVNGYRDRRFEWSQVLGISLPRGAPWATLDLSTGTTVSVMAVQGSDGDRARRAVRELRALIAERTPS